MRLYLALQQEQKSSKGRSLKINVTLLSSSERDVSTSAGVSSLLPRCEEKKKGAVRRWCIVASIACSVQKAAKPFNGNTVHLCVDHNCHYWIQCHSRTHALIWHRWIFGHCSFNRLAETNDQQRQKCLHI